MGFVVKVIDATLFLFFLVQAFAAPVIDAQSCLRLSYLPAFLINLKKWHIDEFGDYLVTEKPHFFVGLVWLELFFQWLIVLLNLYAIMAGKPWFETTCLIYGASMSTSLVALISEMLGSKKASDKLLLSVYFPFMSAGVLAILRGLLTHSTWTFSSIGKRPAIARKKRA